MLLVLACAASTGCPSPTDQAPADGEPSQPKSLPPLRVLVVEDISLADAIQRHWHARSAGLVEIAHAETAEIAGGQQRRLAADVVVYPSGLIGELAQRELLAPISGDELQNPQWARQDIFSLLRLREVSWGEQVYAVPLGSPVLLLYWRKDIFESLGLEPPETWSAYAALAERLSDRAALGALVPADRDWYGAAEPLATGWAGQLLLARAAASARHRSQFSTLFDARDMRPLIDGPPFVRALQELAQTARFAPEAARRLTSGGAQQQILAGHCAMAIGWPGRGAVEGPPAASGVEVAFAELPGSADVYNFRSSEWEPRAEQESSRVTLLAAAGRLGSVTRESRQPAAALSLLFWLSGRELALQVATQSQHTTLFRHSQVPGALAWVGPELDDSAARQYAEVVEAALSRPTWLCSIRIPGRLDYLAALDDAVHAVVAGEASPEQALEQAAQRWTKITSARGLEQQQRAYAKSIGLEP